MQTKRQYKILVERDRDIWFIIENNNPSLSLQDGKKIANYLLSLGCPVAIPFKIDIRVQNITPGEVSLVFRRGNLFGKMYKNASDFSPFYSIEEAACVFEDETEREVYLPLNLVQESRATKEYSAAQSAKREALEPSYLTKAKELLAAWTDQEKELFVLMYDGPAVQQVKKIIDLLFNSASVKVCQQLSFLIQDEKKQTQEKCEDEKITKSIDFDRFRIL